MSGCPTADVLEHVLFVNDRFEANMWDLANGRRLTLGRAWAPTSAPMGGASFAYPAQR